MKKFVLCLVVTAGLLGCAKGSHEPGGGTSANRAGKSGHQVGNGGGGVCLAGQCITISEAGLRIPGPKEEFYLLKPAVVKAVRELVNNLPLGVYRGEILKTAVGTGKNFKLLEIDDPAKMEKIRGEYAEVLRKYKSSIDPRDVTIFAFADGESREVTYLLPAFFKLDPVQQAKILIHEYNVRGISSQTDFESVLELDGYIEDLLRDASLVGKEQFPLERWLLLLSKFHYAAWNANRMAYQLWMFRAYQLRKTLFEPAKFCQISKSSCWPDVAKINENYEIEPGFMRFISNLGEFGFYYDSYFGAPSRIDPRAVPVKCAEMLRPNVDYANFFFPYQPGPVDYAVAAVKCLRKDGRIETEVFDIN
jgi:hypothetical protein